MADLEIPVDTWLSAIEPISTLSNSFERSMRFFMEVVLIIFSKLGTGTRIATRLQVITEISLMLQVWQEREFKFLENVIDRTLVFQESPAAT